MTDNDYRVERDSMGEVRVPRQALWGAQTQRAIQNCPISGLVMPQGFVRALERRSCRDARAGRPGNGA